SPPCTDGRPPRTRAPSGSCSRRSGSRRRGRIQSRRGEEPEEHHRDRRENGRNEPGGAARVPCEERRRARNAPPSIAESIRIAPACSCRKRRNRPTGGYVDSVVWFDVTAPDPVLACIRVETTVRSTYEREAGARGRAVGFKPDREIDSP